MEIKLKGRTFQIQVNAVGVFHVNGEISLSDRTLNGLRQKLLKLVNTAPVNIPVVILGRAYQDDRIEFGCVTGIHARTNATLIRFKGGETDQIHQWNNERRILEITHAQVGQLRKLLAAKLKADAALTEFKKKYVFDRDKIIKDKKIEGQ